MSTIDKKLITIFFTWIMAVICNAQDLKNKDVPAAVRAAAAKKFPGTKKINWEKEKNNYEANWGGKSGEDSSATFTPSATFIEIVVAIPTDQLPHAVITYVKRNYNAAKIREAGKITDASGRHMFEAEIKGKDLVFDEKGVFIKEDR